MNDPNDMQGGKTSVDVTFKEWENLAEAMYDLLIHFRLMYWLHYEDDPAKIEEDPCFLDAINKAIAALNIVGLHPPSTDQFIRDLEREMTEDVEFFRRINDIKAARVHE